MASTVKIECTLAEGQLITNLIKAAFDQERYYAERSDEEVQDDLDPTEVDEEGKPVVLKSRKWEREAKQSAIAKRAELSDLYRSVAGKFLT